MRIVHHKVIAVHRTKNTVITGNRLPKPGDITLHMYSYPKGTYPPRSAVKITKSMKFYKPI